MRSSNFTILMIAYLSKDHTQPRKRRAIERVLRIQESSQTKEEGLEIQQGDPCRYSHSQQQRPLTLVE